ncbi:MAG: hypothetical protein ABI151_14055, partial [Chitinophagaceae bacterium]
PATLSCFLNPFNFGRRFDYKKFIGNISSDQGGLLGLPDFFGGLILEGRLLMNSSLTFTIVNFSLENIEGIYLCFKFGS